MEKYKVFIPISVVQKQNYWVAYCPVLKTFGYSKVSSDEALNDFDNALKTFFHVQEKLGKLSETLRSLGWAHYVGGPNLSAPKLPDFFPEKRYRGENVRKVNREIQVPA